MKLCAVVMKIYGSFFALGICLGIAPFAAGQSVSAITPQSLAGDWEASADPMHKTFLHLSVDGSGALTGTIEVRNATPIQIALKNVQLSGGMLTFFTSTSPGKYIEVLGSDGTKMFGPYMWVKAGGAPAPVAAPFEPLAQIAGDWVTPGDPTKLQILRLRVDANGALTGSIDTPEPVAARIPLTNLQVSGRTLSYTMPDGTHKYEGAFSADGKTVTSTSQSTLEETWQHVRTAAQAAAQEAADAAKPSNGDWSGVANYTANFPGIPPTKGTSTFELHFESNPATCIVKIKESTNDPVQCRMTSTASTVNIETVVGYSATFSGTFSADKNHLVGTWTMGPVFHWTSPVQIDFVRTAPAAH